MEQIFEQFGIKPILLLAQIVNFLVLLLILKKFLYGPILKVLENRKQKIVESLKNAEEIEAKLLQTEEDREIVIRKAFEEAQKIVNEATKSANQIIAQAHAKASADLEEIVRRGQGTIKLERERMQQELRGELANLVVISLEKVTGKILDKEDQKDLIAKSVRNIS